MQHDLQVTIIKELMAQLDEGRNVDAGVQYRMPTSSYICPEIAEREQQAFFWITPSWLACLGTCRPRAHF